MYAFCLKCALSSTLKFFHDIYSLYSKNMSYFRIQLIWSWQCMCRCGSGTWIMCSEFCLSFFLLLFLTIFDKLCQKDTCDDYTDLVSGTGSLTGRQIWWFLPVHVCMTYSQAAELKLVWVWGVFTYIFLYQVEFNHAPS